MDRFRCKAAIRQQTLNGSFGRTRDRHGDRHDLPLLTVSSTT